MAWSLSGHGLAPFRQRFVTSQRDAEYALTGMKTGNTIKMAASKWPLILALWILAGCREGHVGKYVPDAKFVDLYVELKLATVAYAKDLDRVNETRRVILAQYGQTPSDFHDQYVRLMAHPEAWRSFQERVIRKVEEYQVSRKGDTANGI